MVWFIYIRYISFLCGGFMDIAIRSLIIEIMSLIVSIVSTIVACKAVSVIKQINNHQKINGDNNYQIYKGDLHERSE